MIDPPTPDPTLPGNEAPRFQVLALDGGGIKGLFSAALLAGWESSMGGAPIIDHFDLVVGTSTGGIIALGLGAGLRPNDIVRLYADNARRIFPVRRGAGWLRPRFSSQGLAAVLHEALGDRQLWESKVPLVVPAYNLTADRVQVFKTPHHARLTYDWACRMVDVALATSAAPTFFPAHRIGHRRVVDGGLWANNPAPLGIAEAVDLFDIPLTAIRVLSVSTTSDLVHNSASLDRGGRLQWAFRGGLGVMLRAQSVGSNGLAQHLIGVDALMRVDEMVTQGMHRLDRVDADELLGLAETLSREHMPRLRSTFLDHTAQRFTPYYRPGKEPTQ